VGTVKVQKRTPKVVKRTPKKVSNLVIGVDLSFHTVALAACGYDAVMRRVIGPSFLRLTSTPSTPYFEKMGAVTRPEELFFALQRALGSGTVELRNIHICIEEPFPMGLIHAKKFQSSVLKQQCQISGAFLGGLLRYGYINIEEVNNSTWRKPIADSEGISLRDLDKWAVKEWALKAFPGIPVLPDLIRRSEGLIPRPENSKAKAVQPDDVYDAIGIMAYQANKLGVTFGKEL
jgi:hypothetical protein